MNNLLKKINFKSKKKELGELCDGLTELVNSLVDDGQKLIKENEELKKKCSGLELAVVYEKRKKEEAEKVAFAEKQKAVKLQQDLNEALLLVAVYNRMADKAILEKVQLKNKYCQPCTEGPGGITKKEVSDGGAV